MTIELLGDNCRRCRRLQSNIELALQSHNSPFRFQQTGEPGNNDSEIIIRGLSSWNGSAPLVLVDGVERDFSDLDPNEMPTRGMTAPLHPGAEAAFRKFETSTGGAARPVLPHFAQAP